MGSVTAYKQSYSTSKWSDLQPFERGTPRLPDCHIAGPMGHGDARLVDLCWRLPVAVACAPGQVTFAATAGAVTN